MNILILIRYCIRSVSILLFFNLLPIQGQKLADDIGNYKVTWIGNSLPRGEITNDERSHVQHWIWGIEVSQDGRVYAGGGNEVGHAVSVFQDGDLESDFIPKADGSDDCWNWGTMNNGAVSFDDDYMYSVSMCGKVHKWEREPPYSQVQIMTDIGLEANEIVVRNNKMYLVEIYTGKIHIRALDEEYTLINSFTVPGAYDIAVDSENSIWVSIGGGPNYGSRLTDRVSMRPGKNPEAYNIDELIFPLNEVRRYDTGGNQLPGTLGGFGKLMGISTGNHQGHLIVCDDGPDKQVLFYDISDPASPVLVRRFGEQGGIYSGNRGVLDHDLQLFDVQDAGTDADGNIYTLFSQSPLVPGLESGGNMVRAYSPEGEKLWELSSEFWTGCASVLSSTDGVEIYGVEEVFKLDSDADKVNCDPDYRRGFCDPDWKLHAITYDDITNPYDFRVLNTFAGRAFRGSAEIRKIGGKRVNFRQNMYSGTTEGERGYDLLVFEDRPSMISHHKGTIHGSGSAWYPDQDGNVWEGNAAGGKIRMHKFSGFDADGSPSYLTYDEYDAPAWFTDMITRIYYDTDNDVMYLSGYSKESRKDDRWYDGESNLPPGIAGTHLLRYDDWKGGNREPSYEIELPWDGSGRSLPPKTWYAAGDYIFTAPIRPESGKIILSIFDANTGEKAGTMNHYNEFGQTGWIDINRGLTAFKRSNGEYIVIIEDNGFAKNVVYRWTPPAAAD